MTPLFDPYWPSDPPTVPHHFLGLAARAQSWSLPLTTLALPAVTSLPVWPVLVPTASLYVQFLPLTSSRTTLWPPTPETVSTTVLYFLFSGRGRPTPYSIAGFGMLRLNCIVVSSSTVLTLVNRKDVKYHENIIYICTLCEMVVYIVVVV